MSTEQRWQRLQDLFHAACELPTESRETFIQRNSSDDALLRDELLALVVPAHVPRHRQREHERLARRAAHRAAQGEDNNEEEDEA